MSNNAMSCTSLFLCWAGLILFGARAYLKYEPKMEGTKLEVRILSISSTILFVLGVVGMCVYLPRYSQELQSRPSAPRVYSEQHDNGSGSGSDTYIVIRVQTTNGK